MERSTRAGSYALVLFALFWLGAIVAVDILPTPFAADIVTKSRLSGVVITKAGSSAAAAGARVGDLILYNATSYVRRYGTWGGTVSIRVRRGAQTLPLTLPLTTPMRTGSPIQLALTAVAMAFTLLLAAYLGFRKPSVMIAALILFLGGGALSWPLLAGQLSLLPDTMYVPLASALSVVCDWFPVMALASFAVRLPGGLPTRSQQIAIRIVDGIVVATFLGAFVLMAVGLYARAYIFGTAFSGIVVLLASLAALALARPVDRGRTAIVFGGVMVGGVGYAANMLGLRFGEPYWLFQIYANASVIVVSLSLAYAVLRHRVFDVAFVLNRTLVFALTSALVVVIFAALEFLIERFLSDVTHVEGIILQFFVALCVIVSVGQLQHRVDLLVDSVLFRSRHEQETALRRFASTLQFYTEEAPLVRDTIDVLLRYGSVEGAAMYLAQETGLKQMQSSFPVAAPEIDHNDMAYVELRAHHEPLHVHKMPTALPGDRLYPMVRAGRIVGVIATGERKSGEEMPPDIDDAIKRIAHAAATSLGAIESDQIRSELTELRTRLGFT